MDTPAEKKELESKYRQFQRKLLPYAYNIIGDTFEAEDVVQEILNHYFLNPADHISNPDSYVLRAVINRSINAKRRLKMRREKYSGQWLPVPVDSEEGIYREVDRGRILNYSLLVLLEQLNPKERAVFILKESFDLGHAEIGEMLAITEEHSRQLFLRGRKKIDVSTGLPLPSEDARRVIHVLTDAILGGDLAAVKELLSEKARSLSDGGDKMRSARNVVAGKDHVARFLMAMYEKYFIEGTKVTHATLGGHPALLFSSQGAVYRCIIFDVRGGEITEVYILVNPDKLRHFQPEVSR